MRKNTARFMIASIVVFYCTSISGLAGQDRDRTTGRLSVDVADAQDVPIPYAFVLAHSSYGKKDGEAKLNQDDDRFEIVLEPGIYDVFIAAAGFAPVCKAVEIFPGQKIVVKARLLPDHENLQR
jgi:hypothetical protein